MMEKANQQILDEQVSEAELQANIIKLATLRGYVHYHTLHAQGSDPGWPDIVLARVAEKPYYYPIGSEAICPALYLKPRLIIIEVKREGQSPTDEQFFWLETMRLAGLKVYVVWPGDWSSGFVEKILEGQ